VHTRPQEQPKSFFSAGIQKLVERCNKCVELQGDYVAKWYVKLLTVTSIKTVKCILPLLFDSPPYMHYLEYLLQNFINFRLLRRIVIWLGTRPQYFFRSDRN